MEELSEYEKIHVLNKIGEKASEKYDEFLMDGAHKLQYNLGKLRGSLKFAPDVQSMENYYYLEGKNADVTALANYFEYGTGIHNKNRAKRSERTGRFLRTTQRVIKPKTAKYMHFKTNDGKWVKTDEIKGVRPIFAMQKTLKYMETNQIAIMQSILETIQK
jgi:hypothetical protein